MTDAHATPYRAAPEPADYEKYDEPAELTHWTRRFSVRLDKHDGSMSATCQCCGDGYSASAFQVHDYMHKHACANGRRCEHDWRYAGHVGPGTERSVCMKCDQVIVIT